MRLMTPQCLCFKCRAPRDYPVTYCILHIDLASTTSFQALSDPQYRTHAGKKKRKEKNEKHLFEGEVAEF